MAERGKAGGTWQLLATRRGVVSVLSMMFVILFGSLAAAMAIMSRSNIQTAATHQHVTRAMGAAETGLAVAQQRLAEAAGRFIVERGTVEPDFGRRLWEGTFTSVDGNVTILPPRTYADTHGQPRGLAEALAQIHNQDVNIVTMYGVKEPTLFDPVPEMNANGEYFGKDWVITPAVALNMQQSPEQPRDLAFQIEYRLLANGTDVRIFVTGYDFDYQRGGQGIERQVVSRSLRQDFTIVKRVNTAVLSPSKIMIGKNVMVEGDLGAVYTDVDQEYGDPLIMKSDFWGIDAGLDAELTKLFDALAVYDIDHDNRLRVDHPIEGQNLPNYSHLRGYTGSPDVTGDGYLDEFDVFIMYFDADGDGQVVLSEALTAGTPAEGRTPEFTLDEDLAMLIDSSRPDRNQNGVYGFTDVNNNGFFEPGVDELFDYEYVVPAMVPPHLQSYIGYKGSNAVLYRDQVLGFRDGVIDRRDRYAKVSGRIVFRISEGQWSTGQGSDYMKRVQGPIRDGDGDSPVHFAAQPQALPDLSSSSFTNSQTALRMAANGASFEAQVAANLGLGDPSELATLGPGAFTQNGATYHPLYAIDPETALPGNWEYAYFEKMPFNSPSFFDYYYRPVYKNMTFRDVRIPEGNNGLFVDCTFIGVTYVRANIDNVHQNWAIYGRLAMDFVSGRPQPFPPRTEYKGEHPPLFPGVGPTPLMASPPLDKADIPDDEKGLYSNYNSLPDPLLDSLGNRVIDSKLFSNNIRFHDSLFVGSIVSDSTSSYTNSRNKLQFTGATRFAQKHPDNPTDPSFNPKPEDMEEIKKSSMMLPNYSVDIGHFNSPKDQDVRLEGAIVAGVLDVRGNATIHGALLLTFKPVLGEAPLVDALGNPIGNPALFNATIGYFGPEDGDEESLDPATLPYYNDVKIVGWDLCNPECDGIPDLGPYDSPTAQQLADGAQPVPFHGYGRITLRFDPNMALPDGILLPLQIEPRRETYREAAQ